MVQRFGMLEVTSFFKKGKYKYAACHCDCGKESEVIYSNLLGGRTKSCGCLSDKNKKKFKDLSGKKVGFLTVLTPTNQRKSGCIVWKCQCKCGEIVYKPSRILSRNEVKSCGCLRNKTNNITNHVFGDLTVKYPLDENLNWKTDWLCQCKCGNLCEVSYANLLYGHTKSCGCLRLNEYRTLSNGTVIECLNSKIYKNNKSGFKGVYHKRKMGSVYHF